MDRSVQRIDSFNGEFQVEVLRTIGLLIRTDEAVRIRVSNRLRNCSKGFFITDKLYTSTQQGACDLYPKGVQ